MHVLLSINFLLCLGFVFLWNSGYIAAQYVLPMAPPLTLLAWRYWALALILAAYLFLTRRLIWPGGRRATEAAVIGILAHGVWLGCVLYALEEGVPAGIVALVVALQPLLTGLLSSRFVGEAPSIRNWAGLILGFIGVGVAIGSRTTFSGEGTLLGYLLPFGSVLAITVASLMQRKLALQTEHIDLPLDQALFYQSLGTAIVVTLPAIFFEGMATHTNAAFFAGMAWLVVAVSLGSYWLMWVLIRRLDATRVASLFYLGPPTTMLMAWIAFGDRLLLTDWIALFIVAGGIALAQSTGSSGKSGGAKGLAGPERDAAQEGEWDR